MTGRAGRCSTSEELADPWKIAELIRKAIDARDLRLERERGPKQQLYKMFADLHGWQITRYPPTLKDLVPARQHYMVDWVHSGGYHGSCFDHSYGFRVGRQRVAIAAHIYAWQHHKEEAYELAHKIERVVKLTEVDDFPSWYYPGHTRLILWERVT